VPFEINGGELLDCYCRSCSSSWQLIVSPSALGRDRRAAPRSRAQAVGGAR